MNFLSDQVKKFTETKPEEHPVDKTKPVNETEHRPASSSELMASAKVVAEAAQAAARNESDKLDKAKVAGATADILDATQKYGKLDEKSGAGQYIEKAEDYLNQFESSHQKPGAGAGTGGVAPPVSGEVKPAAAAPVVEKKEEEEGSGGGFGDLAKKAQGFMK